MHNPVRRLALAGLIAAGLPLALFAGTAGAAPSTQAMAQVAGHAASPRAPLCTPSGYTGQCNSPTTSGWPEYSGGDNIRQLPSATSTIEGGLPSGVSTTVECYAIGQNEAGDDYWDFVQYTSTVSGYISDAYLATAVPITKLFPCKSGLVGGS